MPELDYMVVADHVTVNHGTILGAGIDTITARAFPTAHTLHVLVRLSFDRHTEYTRPHTVVLTFSGNDEVLASCSGSVRAPSGADSLPVHWRSSLNLDFSFELPLPVPGDYAFDLTIDGRHAKSVDMRALQASVPHDSTARH